MTYKPGDDVIVDFHGHQAPGEIVAIYKSSGYILCRIHIDPNWDYGQTGENLDPEPHVCVREDRVKHASTEENTWICSSP